MISQYNWIHQLLFSDLQPCTIVYYFRKMSNFVATSNATQPNGVSATDRADWTGTKMILHEIEQLFNRDDDVRDVLVVRKLQQEIKEHSEIRLKSAKEIIKKMTAEVATKEAEITAPSQEEHSATLRKISNKENITQQNAAILKIIDAKRKNIAKMAETTLGLKSSVAELKRNSSMADSRTAYAISLYAKISNITWDYKAPPGRLAGCKSDYSDTISTV